MGIRLFVEVLECAPDDLTWRERYALAVLAENANDGTRECWPGIEDDPGIAHRMRLPGRSSRYEVIKALRDKKALETVSAGRRGHRAVYRIPSMGLAKGPETPDANDATGSGFSGNSVRDPWTQTPGQGPGTPDPNSEKGSGNDGLRVRDPHGKGPETPDPFPSDPSDPSEVITTTTGSPDDDLLGPIAAAAEAADKHAMKKFGAFWNAYPRKKSIEKAKTAWRAALDDGADPDLIVAAATAYAYERRGENPNYTPYPATWLAAGRYHDEPDPEPPPETEGANGSGWSGPFRNPENQDVYEEPLI